MKRIPVDVQRRVVNELGEDEKNALWRVIDVPGWQVYYCWTQRDPLTHHGDQSKAWHYRHGGTDPEWGWQEAVSGVNPTNAQTINQLGHLKLVTFEEVVRHTPEGVVYFSRDLAGDAWMLQDD